MTLVRRVARPMLAAMFLSGGLDQLRHPGAKTAVATPVVDKLAGPLHLPKDPELLVRANGAAMLGGGALLATGRLPRVASLVLAGTLVPTTLAAHAFWEVSDREQRSMQKVQFLKNVGLLGGLLLASVDTEGKPGLAYRAKLVRKDATRATKAAGKLTRREAKHAAKSARREAKLATSQAHDALT